MAFQLALHEYTFASRHLLRRRLRWGWLRCLRQRPQIAGGRGEIIIKRLVEWLTTACIEPVTLLKRFFPVRKDWSISGRADGLLSQREDAIYSAIYQ
jgi:hypothetical protein